MFGDAGVGSVNEERLQVGDVVIDALGDASVWPMYRDVLRMAFLEAVPFLIGEDVEVERVELRQVALGDPLGGLVLPEGRCRLRLNWSDAHHHGCEGRGGKHGA